MPVAVFLWECDIGSSYFADKARQFPGKPFCGSLILPSVNNRAHLEMH